MNPVASPARRLDRRAPCKVLEADRTKSVGYGGRASDHLELRPQQKARDANCDFNGSRRIEDEGQTHSRPVHPWRARDFGKHVSSPRTARGERDEIILGHSWIP